MEKYFMLGFQGKKKNLLIKILLKPVEQLYCSYL